MVKRCNQVRGIDGRAAVIAACALCPGDDPCGFVEPPVISDDGEQAALANDPRPAGDPALEGLPSQHIAALRDRWRHLVERLAVRFDVQPVGNVAQRGMIPATVALSGTDGYVFDLVDLLDAMGEAITGHGEQAALANDPRRWPEPDDDTRRRGKKNARITELERDNALLRHELRDMRGEIRQLNKTVCDLTLTSKGIPVDDTSYLIVEDAAPGEPGAPATDDATLYGMVRRASPPIIDFAHDYFARDRPATGDGWHLHDECEGYRRCFEGAQDRALCIVCGDGACRYIGTNPTARDAHTAPPVAVPRYTADEFANAVADIIADTDGDDGDDLAARCDRLMQLYVDLVAR